MYANFVMDDIFHLVNKTKATIEGEAGLAVQMEDAVQRFVWIGAVYDSNQDQFFQVHLEQEPAPVAFHALLAVVLSTKNDALFALWLILEKVALHKKLLALQHLFPVHREETLLQVPAPARRYSGLLLLRVHVRVPNHPPPGSTGHCRPGNENDRVAGGEKGSHRVLPLATQGDDHAKVGEEGKTTIKKVFSWPTKSPFESSTDKGPVIGHLTLKPSFFPAKLQVRLFLWNKGCVCFKSGRCCVSWTMDQGGGGGGVPFLFAHCVPPRKKKRARSRPRY